MATKQMDVAKKNKSDEFYTQLVDIENELKHYKEQLSGKIIFCNCDDPYESNFFLWVQEKPVKGESIKSTNRRKYSRRIQSVSVTHARKKSFALRNLCRCLD